VSNYFEEPKLFSFVDVKYKKFWKSNFTPFLKIRPSKMKILQMYQYDTG